MLLNPVSWLIVPVKPAKLLGLKTGVVMPLAEPPEVRNTDPVPVTALEKVKLLGP